MNDSPSKLVAAGFYLWTHGALRRGIYLVAALAILVITGIHSMAVEKSRPGIDLSMNGSRALYGMIIATSNYGFDSPLYSYYEPIFDIFFTQKTHSWGEVDGLIDRAMALDPKTLTPSNLHMGFGELDSDDKGIILWHLASFELFGPHLGSIYLFYFMLIAISMVAFWLAHRRDEAAVMLLPLYALSHSAMAAYVLAGPTDVMGTLITSRPFAMLAVLPALHLAFLIIRKMPFSRWLAAGAIYQIAFLLLVVTVRSSTKTQVVFLLITAAFMGLCWLRNDVGSFRNLRHHLMSRDFVRRPFVWVMTFLLIGCISLASFYAAAVPSEMRNRGTTGHVFWHAMLAGFIMDKEVLARELWQWGNHVEQLPDVPTNNDKLAYNAIMGFYKVTHHIDLMKVTGGGPDNRDVKLYEAAGRELFLYELKRSPHDVAHLFIIRKTYELRDMARNVRNELHNRPALAAAFVLGLVGGMAWLRSLKQVAPLMLVGLGTASIPAYVFSAGTHIMYDYAPYFYMCFLGVSTTLGAITALLVVYSTRRVLGIEYEPLIQYFLGPKTIRTVSRVAQWALYPLQKIAFRRALYLALALFFLALTSIASLNTEKSRPGIDLSMNGSRVLIGLSIVTSNYGFNSPLYGYYKPVYDIFYTEKTHSWDEVNALIAKALALKPATLSPEKLIIGFNELINDDKGIILWHAASFALFGPHLESIYLLYFALMATSMIVFWLAHRRDEAALTLLPLYALAHMALAAFVLAGNPNVMGTLLTSRPFSMLAILPALHLALLMLRGRHFSPWLAAGAIYQIAFILLAISVRSSAKTQVMLLLLLAAVLLLRWIWNHRNALKINRSMLRLPFIWIVVLLVMGNVVTSALYAATVPSDIRNRSTAGHIVWHSLLASFVLDKTGTLTDDLFQFAQSSILFSKLHANTPKEMIGHDELAFYGVTGFYQSQFNKNIEPFTIVSPEHRDSRFLETCARQLFFHELHRRPRTILRLFVVEKSKELIAMTRDVMMTLHHQRKVAIAFALGLLAGGFWLRSFKTIMPLLVTGLGVSLLPAYLFVPGTHIMYDYAPYFYMGFLSLATTVGALISGILSLELRSFLQKKPDAT